MTVYCNIQDCINWLPLNEIHLMKNKPGFSPIGTTNQYRGRCSFSNIEIKSTLARGPNTKQLLAICNSYNSEESPTEFRCDSPGCNFYLDGDKCEKVKHEDDLYIDWTVAFIDNEKKEVPRCKGFAHRWRENAFDWGRAAVPRA